MPTPAEMMFDGRIQKWTSLLAAGASVNFNQQVGFFLPKCNHLSPIFDCRVFQLPNTTEVYNNFLWRELDATKNSVSMAAQALYTQKELHKKNTANMHDLMIAKGVNWNDYPQFFKRGTYVSRVKVQEYLTEAEIERIPEKNRPLGPITRTKVVALNMEPLTAYGNWTELMNHMEPEGSIKPRITPLD